MIVDCMACPVRGERCDGCVVTVLLEPGSAELPLDASERRAVSILVGAGLADVETTRGLFARREPMTSVPHWRPAGAVG